MKLKTETIKEGKCSYKLRFSSFGVDEMVEHDDAPLLAPEITIINDKVHLNFFHISASDNKDLNIISRNIEEIQSLINKRKRLKMEIIIKNLVWLRNNIGYDKFFEIFYFDLTNISEVSKLFELEEYYIYLIKEIFNTLHDQFSDDQIDIIQLACKHYLSLEQIMLLINPELDASAMWELEDAFHHGLTMEHISLINNIDDDDQKKYVTDLLKNKIDIDVVKKYIDFCNFDYESIGYDYRYFDKQDTAERLLKNKGLEFSANILEPCKLGLYLIAKEEEIPRLAIYKIISPKTSLEEAFKIYTKDKEK